MEAEATELAQNEAGNFYNTIEEVNASPEETIENELMGVATKGVERELFMYLIAGIMIILAIIIVYVVYRRFFSKAKKDPAGEKMSPKKV